MQTAKEKAKPAKFGLGRVPTAHHQYESSECTAAEDRKHTLLQTEFSRVGGIELRIENGIQVFATTAAETLALNYKVCTFGTKHDGSPVSMIYSIYDAR